MFGFCANASHVTTHDSRRSPTSRLSAQRRLPGGEKDKAVNSNRELIARGYEVESVDRIHRTVVYHLIDD